MMINACNERRLAEGVSCADEEQQQQQRTRPTADIKQTSMPNALPPPKSFLLYLVRMGSFTSTPQLVNEDRQDQEICTELSVCEDLTPSSLLERCRSELRHLPSLLSREFTQIISSGDRPSEQYSFRIFQWNILAQALGLQKDNFVACPKDALDWKTRRFRLLEEMLTYSPDFLCLQEVDHFKFFQTALGKFGYRGKFVPKPDSPCIYVKDNNGPDGCALFYNSQKFELLRLETRIVEIWHIQSNQVVILGIFRIIGTQYEFCVITTHLKAKQGSFLSTLRNEQGKDLLDFIQTHYGGRPVVICGDFNAEPSEMVYSTVMQCPNLPLNSCYANLTGSEPPFTTWKIREDGESCHTIDYIFYSRNKLQVDRILKFPDALSIGAGRVPSYAYPSDHFSLVADFTLIPTTSRY